MMCDCGYKKGISITRLCEIIEADKNGKCIIISEQEDKIVQTINNALNIQLYDWQKAYIFGKSNHLMSGRGTGKTLAYTLRLLLTDGPPICINNYNELAQICDMYDPTNNRYYLVFKYQLKKIYNKLINTDLKIRKINFKKEIEL